MNAELLRTVGIDYEAGLARFMGDAELYEAVLAAFAEEDALERAREAFQSGDMTRLMSAAHEAKGSGGSAGLGDVYAEAGRLVALLRGEAYTAEELTAAFRGFETAYATAREGIRAALA